MAEYPRHLRLQHFEVPIADEEPRLSAGEEFVQADPVVRADAGGAQRRDGLRRNEAVRQVHHGHSELFRLEGS